MQYAIRHNIRNHTVFKSDAIIKKIAGLVDTKHKVNLSNPDKVILVEIFQVRISLVSLLLDIIAAKPRHLDVKYNL